MVANPSHRQQRLLLPARALPLFVVGAGFMLQALTAATGIMSARLLGVTGRGEFALIAVISGMALQLTLGGSLPTAIAKEISQRGVSARDGIGYLVRPWAAIGMVPALASAIYLYFALPESGSTLFALAASAFVLTAQGIMTRIILGCLQGEGQVAKLLFAALLPQLLLVFELAAVLATTHSASAFQMAALTAIANALAFIYAYRLLRPRIGAPTVKSTVLWATARRTYVSSIGLIDGLGMDRTLVGSIIGAAPLGLYSAATAVANLSSVAGGALATILLPKVTAAHASPSGDGRVVRNWTLFGLATSVAVVVGIEIILGPLIRIAFGDAFVGATATARWLVLADGLLGFRRVLISVLQARDEGGPASTVELVVAVLTVIGIAVASFAHNLEAVGQTLTAAGVLSCVVMGWMVVRGRTSAPQPA